MSRPTVAEINLSSIKFNIKQLKALAPESLFFPVVKANAYGHGIKKVVKAIDSKVNGYCVATTEEALSLRSITKKSVVCMEGPFDQNELRSLNLNKIDFVLHSKRQLNFYSSEKSISKSLKVWLKIDTGMHRLGFSMEEAENAYLEVLKKTKNIVLMSHFSSAAGTKASVLKSKKQISDFNKIEKKLKKLGGNNLSSLCNSGGLLNYKGSHKDIIRPGISLYGLNQQENKNKIFLKPALTLKTRLISIKQINKGSNVGYDGTWTATENSIIGILPIGYADGYPSSLSNKGYVLVDNKKAPVIGKISMDLIAINLSKLKKTSYESEIILWGSNLPIEYVAKQSNKIPYNLMTSLSERVKRKYIE